MPSSVLRVDGSLSELVGLFDFLAFSLLNWGSEKKEKALIYVI